MRRVVRTVLYLEDLRIGDIFESRTFRIRSEDIKRFANEFDPQPFHLSDADAERSFFGQLVASGWHTAAITMRLLVESVPLAGGILGAGMDEVRWPKPVRPDDVLRLRTIVLELRPLKSREGYGMVKFRGTTLNQHDEAVQIVVGNLVIERRPL